MGKKLLGVALLAVIASGCASTKMVQRDGCWVKRTEKWYGEVKEELGPCKREAPAWAEDRHVRLIQECVAQADYRWQTRASAAFSKGEPVPPQDSEEKILQACTAEAARSYMAENENLKQRLADVSSDNQELRGTVKQNDQQLRASYEKLSDYLGQAAQKPAGTATATASSTSDGRANTENGSKMETATASTPAMFVPAEYARQSSACEQGTGGASVAGDETGYEKVLKKVGAKNAPKAKKAAAEPPGCPTGAAPAANLPASPAPAAAPAAPAPAPGEAKVKGAKPGTAKLAQAAAESAAAPAAEPVK